MTSGKNTIDEKGPIDIQLIRDMLYGDEAYVDEFCEASLTSFNEFRSNFKKNLMEEDLESLRRTGHKIKPVAKMLKLDPILEIYQGAKTMLADEVDQDLKVKYANEMDQYCQSILDQLERRVAQ